MELKKVKIGVVGAGAMGSGIAQVAAAAGHHVYVCDSQPEALVKAQNNLEKVIEKLVIQGKMDRAAGNAIMARMVYVNSLSELRDCGLVIEAVIEQAEVKRSIFASLEGIVANSCILASNTSSLSITSIASSCKLSERVVGLHFFNPAPLMPLVELIPGLNTLNSVCEDAKKLMEEWGKTVVIAKDTPGFIVNRVARSFYGEALRIYEEGLADFETIDWAMKEFGKFRMGPFELMDLIGNDVNYTVTETVWSQLYFDQRYKPALTQKRMVEARRFGRKSGQGYYNYNAGGAMNYSGTETNKRAIGTDLANAKQRNEALGERIFHRIVYMLINEAIDSLYLSIASKEDIDLAMTKGVNYPKGLLRWADELGLERILIGLQGLYEEYGEDRYRPSVLLRRMVKDNLLFYN